MRAQDIEEIDKAHSGKNAKLDEFIKTLMMHRKLVCAFHTKKIFGFGKSSSQLSECWNSQIKGGNSYSRFLRAQSYIETIIHIATTMRIYVDETIIKIRHCVDAKHEISDWIYAKVDASVRLINRCLFPEPRLQGTFEGDDGYELWLLFESVPVQGYLPAFQQRHDVKMAAAACSCNCPYFLSTRLPCPAICAVLARKGHVGIRSLCPFLNPMWLVKSHPIYKLAMSPAEPPAILSPAFTASANTSHIHRMNADAMRSFDIPTDLSARRYYLSTLWGSILPATVASAQLSRLVAEFLVQHRSSLGNAQSILVPPPPNISVLQELSRSGPACEVPNLANTQYRPADKRRKATARARDPSCYSVHKTAVLDAVVKCLCGVEHKNNKSTAYAHRQTPAHKTWLLAYHTAPPSQNSAAAELQVYHLAGHMRYTAQRVTFAAG